MKRFPITSCVIFKAELPSADVLENHLKELLFVDILESHSISYGFIPNKITGELVTPIEGGYIITFRIDEKILPKAAIAFEVNRRIDILKEQGANDLNEAEVKRIAIEEMLKVALTKTKIITALYHVKKGFLIVSSTRKPEHQALVRCLIKACGSVKTETIHVDDAKNGITTRLINYINNEPPADSFGGRLYPCNFYLLQRKVEKKLESVKYDAELHYVQRELSESLSNGFRVSLLELSTLDIIFKLSDNFEFKGIKPISEVDCDGDRAFRHRHVNSLFMFYMIDTIELLIELLKYKEESE
ncbi:recombination-associated protein RdgC [Providencia rettgeri]|nr:recombination-associated protein RdgC [Providencia rettgeri]